LAAEWGRRGVRVNAVAPGYVVTPALEKAVHFDVLDPEHLAHVTALGRIVTVTEVADTVVFLASPLASGITGVIVPVDAGTLTLAGFAPFGRPAART
jgi:NAD(P)-dependent dehydrogenase (short-subunit alcohol dehydrogenase family)